MTVCSGTQCFFPYFSMLLRHSASSGRSVLPGRTARCGCGRGTTWMVQGADRTTPLALRYAIVTGYTPGTVVSMALMCITCVLAIRQAYVVQQWTFNTG